MDIVYYFNIEKSVGGEKILLTKYFDKDFNAVETPNDTCNFFLAYPLDLSESCIKLC